MSALSPFLLGREQTTARILLQGPTAGRLRFQPSRPAPSSPHQVPNEHAENAGTRKRRHPEEAPALDPLENEIDVELSSRTRGRTLEKSLMTRRPARPSDCISVHVRNAERQRESADQDERQCPGR